MKPLDEELIRRLARKHEVLLTIEEGGIGGFGSHVAPFLAHNGLLDGKLRFRPLMIPDTFIEQPSRTTCTPTPASTAPASCAPCSSPSAIRPAPSALEYQVSSASITLPA